jgi:hypothetical protein
MVLTDGARHESQLSGESAENYSEKVLEKRLPLAAVMLTTPMFQRWWQTVLPENNQSEQQLIGGE